MGATNVYVQRPAVVLLQSMTEEVDGKKSNIEDNLKIILVLDKKEIEDGLWEEVEYLIKNEKDKNRKSNVSVYCDGKIDDKCLQNMKKKKKHEKEKKSGEIEDESEEKGEKQVNNETSTAINLPDKNSSDGLCNRKNIYLKKNISVVTTVWIEKCWERKCAVSISFDTGGVIVMFYYEFNYIYAFECCIFPMSMYMHIQIFCNAKLYIHIDLHIHIYTHE